MKLLKNILWTLSHKRVRDDLLKYCQIEYRNSDCTAVYETLLAEYKSNFIGSSK